MSSGERRLTINPFIASSDIIFADVWSPFPSQTTVCVLTQKPDAAMVSKRVLNQPPNQQAVETFTSPLFIGLQEQDGGLYGANAGQRTLLLVPPFFATFLSLSIFSRQ